MNRSLSIILALVAAMVILGSSIGFVVCQDAGEIVAPQPTVKVAICQIFCLDGDLAGNLARIDHALEDARAGGAQIACFPETSLLGWVNPAAHERAEPIPGKGTGQLAALARKHRIWICCGLAEKAGENLHDSVVLLDNEGRLVLQHRKINILTNLMTPPYTAGTSVTCADTPFGKIGLLICADSFKEDILKEMADLDPDLVLIPYGWAAPEDRWPDHGKALEKTVCSAARIIGAPVVGTDLVGQISSGPWKGFIYGGWSLAADRSGKTIQSCRDRDRDIRIVDLKLAR